jgi:hypothetical protein
MKMIVMIVGVDLKEGNYGLIKNTVLEFPWIDLREL